MFPQVLRRLRFQVQVSVETVEIIKGRDITGTAALCAALCHTMGVCSNNTPLIADVLLLDDAEGFMLSLLKRVITLPLRFLVIQSGPISDGNMNILLRIHIIFIIIGVLLSSCTSPNSQSSDAAFSMMSI